MAKADWPLAEGGTDFPLLSQCRLQVVQATMLRSVVRTGIDKVRPAGSDGVLNKGYLGN